MDTIEKYTFVTIILLFNVTQVTGVCDVGWHCYTDAAVHNSLATDLSSPNRLVESLTDAVKSAYTYLSVCFCFDKHVASKPADLPFRMLSTLPCMAMCFETRKGVTIKRELQAPRKSMINVTLLFMTGANCMFSMGSYSDLFHFGELSVLKAFHTQETACNNIYPRKFYAYENTGYVHIFTTRDRLITMRLCFIKQIHQSSAVEGRRQAIAAMVKSTLSPLPNFIINVGLKRESSWTFQTTLGRLIHLSYTLNTTQPEGSVDGHSAGEVQLLLDGVANNMPVFTIIQSEDFISKSYQMHAKLAYHSKMPIRMDFNVSFVSMCERNDSMTCCRNITVRATKETPVSSSIHTKYCMINLLAEDLSSTVKLEFLSITVSQVEVSTLCHGGVAVFASPDIPPVAILCKSYMPRARTFWTSEEPLVLYSETSIFSIVVFALDSMGTVSIRARASLSQCQGVINPWSRFHFRGPYNIYTESINIGGVYIKKLKPLPIHFPFNVNRTTRSCVVFQSLPNQIMHATEVKHIMSYIWLNKQAEQEKIKVSVFILGSHQLRQMMNFGLADKFFVIGDISFNKTCRQVSRKKIF